MVKKLKIVGDFHMPLLQLQKVTNMHNKNCMAVILVLIIVDVMIPLLFYFISMKIYLFLLIISRKVLILVSFLYFFRLEAS